MLVEALSGVFSGCPRDEDCIGVACGLEVYVGMKAVVINAVLTVRGDHCCTGAYENRFFHCYTSELRFFYKGLEIEK